MRFEADVEGAEEIKRALSRTSPKVAKNILRRTVLGFMRGVGKRARTRVPRRKGVLAKALKWRRGKGTRNSVEAGIYFTKKGFYWRFVEFGTVKIAARPFLSPVIEGAKKVVIPYFKRHFWQEYAKEMAKSGKK